MYLGLDNELNMLELAYMCMAYFALNRARYDYFITVQ